MQCLRCRRSGLFWDLTVLVLGLCLEVRVPVMNGLCWNYLRHIHLQLPPMQSRLWSALKFVVWPLVADQRSLHPYQRSLRTAMSDLHHRHLLQAAASITPLGPSPAAQLHLPRLLHVTCTVSIQPQTSIGEWSFATVLGQAAGHVYAKHGKQRKPLKLEQNKTAQNRTNRND